MPLSRLLLRGVPMGSAQRRYEERRLSGREAFDAAPSIPLPGEQTAAGRAELRAHRVSEAARAEMDVAACSDRFDVYAVGTPSL